MNILRALLHGLIILALLFSNLPFQPAVGQAAPPTAAPAAPSQLTTQIASSTFDANLDGWATFGDAISLVYHATGGNPAGYIEATDGQQGVTWFFDAPSKFLGDQSAAYGGTLTFDLKQSDTTNPFFDGNVLLVGAGITLALSMLDSPGEQWTSFSVLLHEGAWRVGDVFGPTASASQLRAVLGSLSALRIRGEYHFGPDAGGLDNVVLRAGPAPCQLATFESVVSAPLTIPTQGMVTSTVNFSNPSLSDYRYLWDLNVSTFLTHTVPDDLVMWLQSPAGTVVTLTAHNGGSDDFAFNGTLWDDQALSPVTDATYAPGQSATPLVPEAKLARFRGENPFGKWSLVISDTQPSNGGRLNQWTRYYTLCREPPPPMATTLLPNLITQPLVLSDNTGYYFGVNASGMPGTICGITLTTILTHTNVFDLVMELRAPSGVTATVVSHATLPGSSVFSNTVWTDLSPLTVHAVGAAVGSAYTFAPEGSLSRFLGEKPNGNWILYIGDLITNGLTGRMYGFKLGLASCGTDRVRLPTIMR